MLGIGGPQLAGIVAVAAVLFAYGVIALARKRRFEALGARLGATVVDVGWFKPGRLEGGDFTVDARARGAGRYSRYSTTIRVAAPGAPGSYLVRPGFFDAFPNWKFALALGTHTERAFVVSVSFPRYGDANAAQRQALLAWLETRPSFDADHLARDLRRLRIREFIVTDADIAVTFSGAVSRFDRIYGTLSVLRRLAA